LTLIGLFPVLGSLAKGCCKILFAYGRKFAVRSGAALKAEGFWDASRPFVEAGIGKLNQHLQTHSLRALNIQNPYRWLAGKLREVIAQLKVAELTKVFDELIDALRQLLDLVRRWGSAAMASRAGQLLESVLNVRRMANQKLEGLLGPVRDWLERLARRLDIEA
ncbi:hypothetical protein P3W55_28065, partial [Pseudomonas citronellolis]|nr:hypothetical protein [Pseudomonas citronellolis]